MPEGMKIEIWKNLGNFGKFVEVLKFFVTISELFCVNYWCLIPSPSEFWVLKNYELQFSREEFPNFLDSIFPENKFRETNLSRIGWQPKVGVKFEPSLLNTVVFLVSTVQSVSVFVVNYKGRPFMQSITQNRSLLYSLGLCAIGMLLPGCDFFFVLKLL
jgi:magnesium-transporting ATPase (P-type)